MKCITVEFDKIKTAIHFNYRNELLFLYENEGYSFLQVLMPNRV